LRFANGAKSISGGEVVKAAGALFSGVPTVVFLRRLSVYNTSGGALRVFCSPVGVLGTDVGVPGARASVVAWDLPQAFSTTPLATQAPLLAISENVQDQLLVVAHARCRFSASLPFPEGSDTGSQNQTT